MANIKVELSHEIIDGQPVTFVAPCDCTAITGLKVYYPNGAKEFTFRDAHGNDLTGLGNLFAAGAYVKAILDVTNGFAYIQNADTNAYLEAQLDTKQNVATYHYSGMAFDADVAAWLDEILATMPNHSAVTVSGAFFNYSHVAYGILYKNTNDWASLYTTSYVDEEWRRVKYEGVWGPSECITRMVKALDSQVISEGAFTYGKGNFAGLKGYYYSSIDFETNAITLSGKQLAVDGDGIQLTWEVGDKVTIVSDSKYDLCSTITGINGNVITVDSLPFAELGEDEPDWDDYCIFVPAKPEAGIVDLGRYATAIGEGNTVTARAAIGIGRANNVQGMYGVALGRSNVIKAYGGIALGAYNTIESTAQYASAEGLQNKAFGAASHVEGSNSNATGAASHAEGSTTKASGVASHSQGSETIASGAYSHAGGDRTTASGEGSTAFGIKTVAEGRASLASGLGVKAIRSNSAWFGQYNDPESKHIFGIGLGINETSRANAFAICTNGNSDFFGHRATCVADAVDAGDAVNLRMLNARTNDYVVAQGTSGIWTYRKWNSGVAEFWTSTFDFDGLGVVAGGCNKTTLAFPFNLSGAYETITKNISISRAFGHGITASFGVFFNNYCEVYVNNFGATDVSMISLDIFITGRWK